MNDVQCLGRILLNNYLDLWGKFQDTRASLRTMQRLNGLLGERDMSSESSIPLLGQYDDKICFMRELKSWSGDFKEYLGRTSMGQVGI